MENYNNWPVKSQNVRIVDVFVIGPLMLYAGLVLTRKHPTRNVLAGWLLAAFGVSTIVYNAINYQTVRKGAPQ